MLVHYIVIALVNKCLAMSTGLDGQDDHVNEFVLVFDSQPNFLPLGQWFSSQKVWSIGGEVWIGACGDCFRQDKHTDLLTTSTNYVCAPLSESLEFCADKLTERPLVLHVYSQVLQTVHTSQSEWNTWTCVHRPAQRTLTFWRSVPETQGLTGFTHAQQRLPLVTDSLCEKVGFWPLTYSISLH